MELGETVMGKIQLGSEDFDLGKIWVVILLENNDPAIWMYCFRIRQRNGKGKPN